MELMKLDLYVTAKDTVNVVLCGMTVEQARKVLNVVSDIARPDAKAPPPPPPPPSKVING